MQEEAKSDLLNSGKVLVYISIHEVENIGNTFLFVKVIKEETNQMFLEFKKVILTYKGELKKNNSHFKGRIGIT